MIWHAVNTIHNSIHTSANDFVATVHIHKLCIPCCRVVTVCAVCCNPAHSTNRRCNNLPALQHTLKHLSSKILSSKYPNGKTLAQPKARAKPQAVNPARQPQLPTGKAHMPRSHMPSQCAAVSNQPFNVTNTTRCCHRRHAATDTDAVYQSEVSEKTRAAGRHKKAFFVQPGDTQAPHRGWGVVCGTGRCFLYVELVCSCQ